MNKYREWLDKALAQISNEFLEGSFDPQNESDVKCYLHDAFLSTKRGIKGLTRAHSVRTEFPASDSRERIDLALVKKTKTGNEPRLLLEIKETKREHLPLDDIEKRLQHDVNKLLGCKRSDGELIERVVYFFFRGAHKHGVGVRTNDCMEQLRRKCSGVNLEWGPR